MLGRIAILAALLGLVWSDSSATSRIDVQVSGSKPTQLVNAQPDMRRLLRRAARTRKQLEQAQIEITRMKSGPGPDGTDPVVAEVPRADGLWPYLLIRHYLGDAGVRPLDANMRELIGHGEYWSQTSCPPAESGVIDRDGFPALQARVEFGVTWGIAYDIWAHVWNLGQAPATGVRVRAFLTEVDRFIGGRQLDLGDRLSATCHRVVKVATYTPGTSGESTWTPLVVVAECLSDVASGDRSPGMDRHCAQSWLTAN